MKPAIVVAGYNRDESLKRLLQSLSKASYPKINITLVISIDRSNNDNVREVAEKFTWKHGKKEVILHKERLGLKKHILVCGDLTNLYDSIILLEDDLFVSPYYYNYTVDSLRFYEEENRVAGISLYNYKMNEYVGKVFEPIHDGNDIYFIQTASSWGQAWTKEQWNGFRTWYNRGVRYLADNDKIPNSVINWSEKSWKKYFIKYMVENNKYFVFPRISLTTNCGDIGEHHKSISPVVQVPILNGYKTFRMCNIKDSLSIYDAYYEIIPSILNRFNEKISKYDYEVDIYGQKNIDLVEKKYVITKKKCKSNVASFPRTFRPPELAIIYSIEGEGISLCHKNDVMLKEDSDEVFYSHPDISFGEAVNIVKYKFMKKIRSMFFLKK